MSPPVIARRTECPGSNRCTIAGIVTGTGCDGSLMRMGAMSPLISEEVPSGAHVVEFREHHRLSGRRNTQRHSGSSHHVHRLGHRRSGPERLGSRNLCIRNVSGRIDI